MEEKVSEPVKEEPKKDEPVEQANMAPSSTDLIDRANEAAQRLEKANKTLEKNLARQEALQVEKTLGGNADVRQAPKEETPQEYKDRVMRGEFNDQRN